jgi:ubiquitin-specific protease-like protein
MFCFMNVFSQEEVAKEFGIPIQFQRYWLWAKRQNHTYRPNRPLTPLEETQSVCFQFQHFAIIFLGNDLITSMEELFFLFPNAIL